MKPHIHAESSAKRFGGKPEDYLKIHDWFDQTKAHFSDNRHRALLHSSFGIFLCEQVFGHTITNSKGNKISVRDIGEQHVIEDLNCIPNVSDYLSEMKYQPWMHGKGLAPSTALAMAEAELAKPTPAEIVFDGSGTSLQRDQHGPPLSGYWPEYSPFMGPMVADGNIAGANVMEEYIEARGLRTPLREGEPIPVETNVEVERVQIMD